MVTSTFVPFKWKVEAVTLWCLKRVTCLSFRTFSFFKKISRDRWHNLKILPNGLIYVNKLVNYELEGPLGIPHPSSNQVWSQTQFYSVDFSKSWIGVKKCVFHKHTIKVCVSCCLHVTLGPPCIPRFSRVPEATDKAQLRAIEGNGVPLRSLSRVLDLDKEVDESDKTA